MEHLSPIYENEIGKWIICHRIKCYNFNVDVFLSADAQRTLQALTVLSAAKISSGLLLGHKRAGRFFVEAAFPAPAGFRPTPENFPVLSETFQGRIIGFFLMGGSAADRRAFLQPLACGRCLVAVASRTSKVIARRKSRDISHIESGDISYRGFLIDYDGRFRFDPIAVISEGKSAAAGCRIKARGKAPYLPLDKPETLRETKPR